MNAYVNEVWNKVFKFDYIECKFLIYKRITLPSVHRSNFDKIYYFRDDYERDFDNFDNDTYIFAIDCDDIVCDGFLDKVKVDLNRFNYPEILMWNTLTLDHFCIQDINTEERLNQSPQNYPGSTCFIYRKSGHKFVKESKLFFEMHLKDYWKISKHKVYADSRNYTLELKNVTSLTRLITNWNDFSFYKKKPKFLDAQSLIDYVQNSLRTIERILNDDPHFLFKKEIEELYRIYKFMIL
jgi:hypothetical protein